jgi:MFS family permease
VSYDAAFNGYLSRVRHFSHNARAYVAYYFLLSVHLGIYGVIFNLYILRLGFREDLLGLMLSIVFISTGLAAVPAAGLCDRIGRKNTLLFSILVTSSALLLLYTIASLDWLLALSALYGMGTAFYTVAGSPFLMENSTHDERIHLFSVNSALSQAAYIVGCMAGGTMPNVLAMAGVDAASPEIYRYTLFLSLALIALSAVPILYMNEAGRRPKPVKRFAVLGSTVTSSKVQKLIAVNGLIGIGAGMIVPFFNVYFHNLLAAATDQIGIIFSAGELVMIAGLMVIPLIVERSGKVKTIALTELASIPFLIMLAFTANIYVAAFAYIMRMTLMNMANPAINSFNMELVPDEQRATVSSLTSMAWYLCMSLSAYLSGIMMARSNYVLPFMITCATYLCAASLYYLFFSRVEKETARASLPGILIPAKR